MGLLISLLIVSASGSPPGACPRGWHPFKDDLYSKCFYANNTMVTYLDNHRLCDSINGSMVSIHSKTEDNYIVTFLGNSPSHWLGGTQVSAPYAVGFKWSDGSDFDFKRWAPGYPRGRCVEKYCSLLATISITKMGWIVTPSNLHYSQICQRIVASEVNVNGTGSEPTYQRFSTPTKKLKKTKKKIWRTLLIGLIILAVGGVFLFIVAYLLYAMFKKRLFRN